MLGRRFILLVAVLLGLMAIAASVAPRQPDSPDQRAAEPAPSAAPAAAGPSETVRKQLSTAGKPKRVVVDRGTVVELEVDGSELDSVTLGGEVEVVTEETNAIFNVFADTPGDFPIELVDADRLVGTLVVRD